VLLIGRICVCAAREHGAAFQITACLHIKPAFHDQCFVSPSASSVKTSVESGGWALLTRALDHPCLSRRPFTFWGSYAWSAGRAPLRYSMVIGVGMRVVSSGAGGSGPPNTSARSSLFLSAAIHPLGLMLGPPERPTPCVVYVHWCRCVPLKPSPCVVWILVLVCGVPRKGARGGGSGRLAPSRVDRYARGLHVARSGNALGAVNLRLLRMRLTASSIFTCIYIRPFEFQPDR
jgi:hypothetical protein